MHKSDLHNENRDSNKSVNDTTKTSLLYFKSMFCFFFSSALTSPNNTGIIAACVVVAILLMVTLAVLLFLYLRMREHDRSRTQNSGADVADPSFANELYEPVRISHYQVYVHNLLLIKTENRTRG